ncbi:SGNH/GDSL hydrolase family protein [Candidatus Binatia bacterium]|nr:SGNH/GDSL hydrolase family protein [Candidatus Binatia bacterium]
MQTGLTGRVRAALWKTLRRTAAVSALLALVAPARASGRAADGGWVTVWTTSPQAAGTGFSDQTLRLIVSPHGAGATLRIRLTNRYAAAPVTFAEVHVGRRAQGAALVAGSNRRVSFGGARSVTVPAGQTVVSDPVRLEVRPFDDLAVSIRIDGTTGPGPVHLLASQTSYVTPPGASARGDEEDGDAYTQPTTSLHYLAAIDVREGRTEGAIGIIGDSITDGIASTPDTNRRWPDVLQRRLLAEPRLARLAVLNAGISGNQVTRAHATFGDAAVDRVTPDLLELSGLRALMFLEGINDIGGNTPPRATAAEIIAGYRRLIAAARERGLAIMALTLTPTAPNPGLPGHTDEQAVAVRRDVNHWLRTSGELDAVFDAEEALTDPATGVVAAAFDSGDGLHPNDAGMEAIAATVELDALLPLACRAGRGSLLAGSALLGGAPRTAAGCDARPRSLARRGR